MGKAKAEAATATSSEVLSVPAAGARLGLGRSASYEAARRGDLPCIKIGGRRVVPRRAIDRLLGLEGT